MSIRFSKLKDMELVNQFLKAMHVLPFSLESFQNPSRTILMMEEKGTVIGALSFLVLSQEAELEAIYVLPKYRNRGFATIFIEAMIEECKKKFCQKIFLEVRESNQAAIKLYEKHSFICINRRVRYYGEEDGLVMCKELR